MKAVIYMNQKKLKRILAIVMIIAGVIWLVPTIFVKTVIYRTTEYTVVSESDTRTTFRVAYTYPYGDGERTAYYTDTMAKNVYPLVGEQGVCHYHTFPPHAVFLGDAKSPVPPLVCIALGALVWVFKKPKWLKRRKKEQQNAVE